jgi:hypothetical protein
MAGVEAAGPSRGQRLKLLAIMALFFAPMVVAAISYAWLREHGVANTTNYGQWVQPPRTVAIPASWQDAKGQAAAETMRGRWGIVQVQPGECTRECQETAILLRQVWVLLNKDSPRVHRVLFAGTLAADTRAQFIEALGEATVMEAAMPTEAGFPAASSGKIYLVDPNGNLILEYGFPFEPKRFQEDLRRLLKASQIG